MQIGELLCVTACVCIRANKQEQAVGPLIMLIGLLIANACLVQMEMLLVAVAYVKQACGLLSNI